MSGSFIALVERRHGHMALQRLVEERLLKFAELIVDLSRHKTFRRDGSAFSFLKPDFQIFTANMLTELSITALGPTYRIKKLVWSLSSFENEKRVNLTESILYVDFAKNLQLPTSSHD